MNSVYKRMLRIDSYPIVPSRFVSSQSTCHKLNYDVYIGCNDCYFGLSGICTIWSTNEIRFTDQGDFFTRIYLNETSNL